MRALQHLLIPRNRVSPKEAFEGLELCEGKLSCTVLRGLDGSNPVRLLGHPLIGQNVATEIFVVRRETIRNVLALCSRRRLKNLFVLSQLAKLCAKASNVPHQGTFRAIIHTQK